MNKEELETLHDALAYADQYFSSWCEFTDTYVLSQDEIDQLDDESEVEQAQEMRNYEDTLKKAFSILEKYMKGE